MVDQRLIDYISSAVDKGKSPEEIKKILLERGWMERDVDEAIYIVTQINKSPQPEEKVIKEKGGNKRIYLIGFLIVLIIIVGSGYYIFMLLKELPLPIEPECGNIICEKGETYENCASDCEEPYVPPPVTGSTIVYISPLTKTVANGQTFTLEIMVSNVTDLFGFQFNLEYDSNIVEFDSLGESNFLSKNGTDNIFCVDEFIQQLSGLVKNIACVRLKKEAGGVSGEGILRVVNFKAVGKGESKIRITNLELVSIKEEKIEAKVEDGMVKVL
ncbi:MAG: cohesin domain-containing protein [Candidatus Aenigmatarchaeota archaeon]